MNLKGVIKEVKSRLSLKGAREAASNYKKSAGGYSNARKMAKKLTDKKVYTDENVRNKGSVELSNMGDKLLSAEKKKRKITQLF